MRFFCLAVGLLAFGAPSALAQTTSPGWSASATFNPGGAVRQLSTGELIAWDGQVLSRQAADGSSQVVLHDFMDFQFTGVLAIDPTETFAVIGRGNDDIFTADLTAGGVTPYASLPFGGFDAEFSPDGWCAISAASSAPGSTAVSRCEFNPPSIEPILFIAGPSGPVAFTADGNLLYAPGSSAFPQPVGSANMLLFLQTEIDALVAPNTLLESDGIPFAAGFDGISSIRVDPTNNFVYIAENNFGTGVNRVRSVLGVPASSPILYEGVSGQTISLQSFVPASDGAFFSAFQPDLGGLLTFSATNFYSVFDRFELRPERPDLAFTGPGTTGIGPFDLEVSGALPAAGQLLMFGPAATSGPELPVAPFLPPLFVGLDVNTIQFFPFTFVADSEGALDVGLFNVTGAVGAIAAQMLLLNEAGFAIGTSSLAIL